MRVKFVPEATAELEEALNWCGVRSSDAERAFSDALDAALAKIINAPERFLRLTAIHRSCSVERFPYQNIYRRNGDLLMIIAVAHAKRRPGYWKRRR